MRHLAILVVLALTLLGCGGSDSDTDTPTTAPVTTTGSGDTTTTSPAATATSTSGSNGGVILANCPELMTWTNDFVMASQAAFGGTSPTGFEYTAEYFQEFADRAPAEIRDDMQVIADAFGGFFDALAELDVDFGDPAALATLTPAQIEQLEDAAGMMDSDAVGQAGDNINSFFERECS